MTRVAKTVNAKTLALSFVPAAVDSVEVSLGVSVGELASFLASSLLAYCLRLSV